MFVRWIARELYSSLQTAIKYTRTELLYAMRNRRDKDKRGGREARTAQGWLKTDRCFRLKFQRHLLYINRSSSSAHDQAVLRNIKWFVFVKTVRQGRTLDCIEPTRHKNASSNEPWSSKESLTQSHVISPIAHSQTELTGSSKSDLQSFYTAKQIHWKMATSSFQLYKLERTNQLLFQYSSRIIVLILLTWLLVNSMNSANLFELSITREPT